MDAPPETEDCRPFVAVAERLQGAGLNAPEVLAADLERGMLLLGDLGTRGYLDALSRGPDPDTLMLPAIDALVRWQAATEPGSLPPFDATLLRRELALFRDWLLDRHLGIALPDREARALATIEDALVDRLSAQWQCNVHRDYMPRNLMVCEPLPGIIDFQDAVIGPYAYDLLCLCKDAFISWPAERVAGWQRHYHAAARAAGLPVPGFEPFLADFDAVGVQRHLKVAGIFARLHHRDGKSDYLSDVPRFIGYLEEASAGRAEYAGLSPILARVRDALPA